MRETRLSGSVEGVMGNHDSYSDSPRGHVERFGGASDGHTQPVSARELIQRFSDSDTSNAADGAVWSMA
jgi:hypothetical protein